MPDWRNAGEYEFTSELTGEQWAWEFLRRNPDYIKDYHASIEPERLWLEASRDKKNEHSVFVPPKKDQESTVEWQRLVILTGTTSPHIYSPGRYYALRWPITENIKNPSDDEPPAFKPARDYPRLLDYSDTDSYFSFPEENPESAYQHGSVAIVCLHLSKPIDAQLDRIRGIYNDEKCNRELDSAEGTKLDLTRWKNYLRILDAKAENVNAQETCRIIFPDHYDERTPFVSDKEISRQFSKIKFLRSTEGIYTILKAVRDSNPNTP